MNGWRGGLLTALISFGAAFTASTIVIDFTFVGFVGFNIFVLEIMFLDPFLWIGLILLILHYSLAHRWREP